MDRTVEYTGAIPLSDDMLRTQRFVMTALAMLSQAVLGTSTLVDGLACTPTGPASLNVLVGPGSIYSVEELDATAYGDLDADADHTILKQGISLDTTTLAIAPPGTTGQSRNYLIQVQYQDQDTDDVVLPYFNSSDPTMPYNRPANAGTSNHTTRKGACVINTKAGTAATTGTQVTPTPDAGFTGLWVVAVANGASSIVSGNITPYTGASAATGLTANWSTPFLIEKLADKISIATGDLRYAPLSGGAGTRTRLTNDTNFYVATTGNDSNNGTSGTPWLTLQHAINVIANGYDLNGFTATINVGNGTYTAGVIVSQPFVGGTVQLTGNTTTPTNCNIAISSAASCILVTGPGSALNVAGFNIATSSSGLGGVVAIDGGVINVNGNMNYGAVTAGNEHLSATFQGRIKVTANYTISGNAYAHATSQNDGVVSFEGTITATLSGTPAFANAFFWTQIVSLIWAVGYTVSGSGTGVAYIIAANAILQMNGAGFTFTGASAGTTATGGAIV